MKIATVMITYNRPVHTERVLNALRNNTVKPEKLFIFQDIAKNESDADQCREVYKIISEVDWCECEVIIPECHCGTRKGVVRGINCAMEDYDAAIILEDDCVTHPLFMDYMYKGLQKYAECRQVYSINGYAYPIDIAENGTDAYFTGRTSSWGWGTWKDRWMEYEEDYDIMTRINKDKQLKQQQRFWGEDRERYLFRNLEGKCDSWAVFWGLKVIEKGGYCLSPYKSLVSNIGVDGSGAHSGKGMLQERLRSVEDTSELRLPDTIEITEECRKGFSAYFAYTSEAKKWEIYNSVLIEWIMILKSGGSLADYLRANKISKVSVWGLGKVGYMVLDDLLEAGVEVLSVILTKPFSLSERGVLVVDKNHIPDKTEMIIVIPAYDTERIYDGIKDQCKCTVIGIDKLVHNCLQGIPIEYNGL